MGVDVCLDDLVEGAVAADDREHIDPVVTGLGGKRCSVSSALGLDDIVAKAQASERRFEGVATTACTATASGGIQNDSDT